MNSEQYEERKKLALHKLEEYVADMLNYEKIVSDKFFGKLQASSNNSNNGKDVGVGGTEILSSDIKAMDEVLRRFDGVAAGGEVARESARSGKGGAAATGDLVSVGVNTKERQASDESFFKEDDELSKKGKTRARASKRRDYSLNISVGRSLASRVIKHRQDFLRHRELGEAALLNSGYSQWQVIEIIADDIVDGIVGAVGGEIERTIQKSAEGIINRL